MPCLSTEATQHCSGQELQLVEADFQVWVSAALGPRCCCGWVTNQCRATPALLLLGLETRNSHDHWSEAQYEGSENSEQKQDSVRLCSLPRERLTCDSVSSNPEGSSKE